MSILKILDQFNTKDMSDDQFEIFSSRRAAFKKMGNYTKKLSLAAIPTAFLASMPKTLLSQSTGSAESILNFAFTLEQLEYQFYKQGNAAGGLIPSEDMHIFQTIGMHEEAHVNFLRDVIGSLGGTPFELKEENFDFTAGGTFNDVFSNYQTFLALSQAFEDTGVRAYKGQAANVRGLGDNATVNQVLTSALSIHGVEARHASEVRRLRMQKGWITNRDDSVPAAAAAVYGPGMPAEMYPAEDNVTQGGVNLADALGGMDGLDMASITEAFDEPLDANTSARTGTVYDIATLFINS